jgi:hypothetical protein
MSDVIAPGAMQGAAGPSGDPPPRAEGVIIDNRTELPDEQVREAIMSHWVENAALQFGVPSTFQMYATNQGSNMLTRSPFRAPSSPIQEIELARQVADTDDDITSVIGQAIATAYRDGMENQHPDEPTLDLFNQIAFRMHLDSVQKEMMREWLIAGQVTTLQLFTRSRLNFTPTGTERKVNAQLAVPLVGVLPSENIRVLSTDLFGNGELAYDVTTTPEGVAGRVLQPERTPARRGRRCGREPVIAALFTKRCRGGLQRPGHVHRGPGALRAEPAHGPPHDHAEGRRRLPAPAADLELRAPRSQAPPEHHGLLAASGRHELHRGRQAGLRQAPGAAARDRQPDRPGARRVTHRRPRR